MKQTFQHFAEIVTKKYITNTNLNYETDTRAKKDKTYKFQIIRA